MSIVDAFKRWRADHTAGQSWGLAWFLANEICQRFYASHGIVPWVISHEGLGYYGIGLHELSCRVHGNQSYNQSALGRLTMAGNVENWKIGGPGDHGLEGTNTEDLVKAAIHQLGLPSLPRKSHLHCRHKRWGSSFVLCFEVATLLALEHEGRVAIWNYPGMTERTIRPIDPDCDMKEHPGAFVFQAADETVALRGDGLLLGEHSDNLWGEYMQGASASALASDLATRLRLA